MFMAACWTRAAAPAACSRTCGSSGRTCRRSGVEWAATASARAAAKSDVPIARGSVNALPFAEASFDAAVAADLLCHRAVDPAHGAAELRRVLRPAAGWSSTCPPTPGCCRSTTGWCTTSAAAPHASSPPCCARPASSGCARATGTACCCRSWSCSASCWRAAAHASDVASFPPWLDAMFHAITEIERRLPFRLPAGGSVLATAERP